ncbi:twin-arginine translocase TatA/TatE family subunit [Frischella sp. Ac48]|uniref:Sec-independent protein translocase protein TatA n=1 Tax=Frischella japonica TaxID=2741544 RepID=A0ABR7QYH7_9GAMM|nr:twin-arginine translocase TatA/TatE family subunit [Frischella japonica]MBX4132088.1 twin-arginine translocase TatA/TatE family subunit [Frischella sp. Ac48]
MISWPKLLILLAIAVLVLGTNRLRTLGSDLGAAIKGFKKELADDNKKTDLVKDDFANKNDHNG